MVIFHPIVFLLFFSSSLSCETGELALHPGVYRYNFHIQLPFGLPTSIEAQVGHIRYGLQVVLDRHRWPDQKFEETFTVIKPLNLNYDTTLRVNLNACALPAA